MHRLPAALLAIELPEPRTILESWGIGPRTRTALEEVLARGERLPLRLGDYVGASRIGASVLIDLLAAREEAAQLTPDSSGQAALAVAPHAETLSEIDLRARAPEIAEIVRGVIPCHPSKLGKALVASGLVAVPPSFEEVRRAYRIHRVAAPFRIARRGGVALLAARDSITSIEALVTNAKRLVFHWGVCGVSALLDRLRAIRVLSLDTKAVTRVLTAIPRFRWIDQASGWFSLVGANSRLMSAVRKIFTIADRVRRADLVQALVKQVHVLAKFPARAIDGYLRDILGCEICDGWVRLRAAPAQAALSRAERAVVQALRQHGGTLRARSLHEHASRMGITRRAVRTLVDTSPFITSRGDHVRLLGEQPRPAGRQHSSSLELAT